MTPEGRIIAWVKVECKRLGLRFVRISMRNGVEVGWPDCIILGSVAPRHGLTLWLETKAPGKPLRPIQEERRREIRERGGLHEKPDTKEQVTLILENFKAMCNHA